MLGFAPISTATLGGSGVARPIVNQVLSGVAATVSLGAISAKTDAKISEIAIRKPNTTFFYDPNNDGVGEFRNNEHPRIFFENYNILGFDPNLEQSTNSIEPTWNGTYPHAEKFGITARVSDGPITYQGAHAPLVNGNYAFPASVNDAGLEQYRQPPHLRHLPETITNGAATISSLADPLVATLTFPADDPSLFSVIVGQVRTLNTYDSTDSDTYFSQSLMSSGVGEITLPGKNKSRELFHLFADKGFQIGPISVGTFGTDKTSLAGAAWVLYGTKLQPQITASHFPDGRPVSQEHTFLVTTALGQIKPAVTANLVGVFATATLGNVQPNNSVSVTGLLIGTALTPDPPWYLNPSRPQLSASFVTTISLGALAGPYGVDVEIDSVPTITTAVGQVTTRSFNTVPMPSLPAITTAVGNLEGAPTEIVSDSFSITVSLGAITTTSVANATATSFAFGVSFGSVTPVANSNVFPTGFGPVLSLNSSLTLIGLANHGLQSQVATVRLSALRKQVYATFTSSKPMPPALPNFVKLAPANSNFALVDRKTNQSVVSAKLTGLG